RQDRPGAAARRHAAPGALQEGIRTGVEPLHHRCRGSTPFACFEAAAFTQVASPRRPSSPSPLAGEGWVGGDAARGARISLVGPPPTPARPRQGGGGRGPRALSAIRKSRSLRGAKGAWRVHIMLSYAAKRLGLAVAVVATVIAVLFLMIYIIPGDPLSVALGP